MRRTGTRQKPRVTAPVEDVDLPPARRRWRIKLVAALIAAAVLLGVRAWWGWIGERRLNATIAELRAAGALPPGPPPGERQLDDAHNAVPLLRQAAELAVRHGSDPDLAPFDFDQVPLPAEAAGSLNRLVRANGDALAAAHAARRIGLVWWGDRTNSYDPSDDLRRLSGLNVQRGLGNLLGYSALQAHAAGDDAEAVERLRDAVFLAHAMDRERQFFAIAVSMNVRALACDRLHTICPTLHIGSGVGAASPEQVRAVCEELTDDRDFAELMLLHEKLQAAKMLDWVQGLRTGDQQRGEFTTQGEIVRPPPWLRFVTARAAGPFYPVNGSRYVQRSAEAVRVLRGSDLPSIRAHLPLSVVAPCRTGLFGADWASNVFNSTDELGLVVFVWKGPTLAHLAAAELAIRWYAVEHGGNLPRTLAELVPRYVHAVPSDPFAPAGTPIGYMPLAARPFVYSVWDNGSDLVAAGRWKVPPTLSDADIWRQPNLVWFLTPAPPATMPATQPTTSGSSEADDNQNNKGDEQFQGSGDEHDQTDPHRREDEGGGDLPP